MKSLREQLRQISRAMEFANIDTYNEFNRLLESHETAASLPCAATHPSAARACAYERERRHERSRIADFGAFIRHVTLKTSGQH